MNSCHFQGWLPRDAEVRTSPKSGAEMMFFQLVVKTVAGEDECLYCRCDDAVLIARQRALMTKARVVSVRAAADRFWCPWSGFSGAIVAFRVLELEIADRSSPLPPPAVEDGAEKTEAAA